MLILGDVNKNHLQTTHRILVARMLVFQKLVSPFVLRNSDIVYKHAQSPRNGRFVAAVVIRGRRNHTFAWPNQFLGLATNSTLGINVLIERLCSYPIFALQLPWNSHEQHIGHAGSPRLSQLPVVSPGPDMPKTKRLENAPLGERLLRTATQMVVEHILCTCVYVCVQYYIYIYMYIYTYIQM